jgi:hypothetical protein
MARIIGDDRDNLLFGTEEDDVIEGAAATTGCSAAAATTSSSATAPPCTAPPGAATTGCSRAGVAVVCSSALVHGGWCGDGGPTCAPLQAARTETGLAVLIMRLSTPTARATSPC